MLLNSLLYYLAQESTSSVRGKRVWAYQQWDVIVFLRFLNDEAYLNPGIKRRSISTFEIFVRFEDDLVSLTCVELRVFISSFLGDPGREEVQTTTVRVGHPVCKRMKDV